eukprot:scaffold208554_cov35-Tisochrysis_lutea.AAC.3
MTPSQEYGPCTLDRFPVVGASKDVTKITIFHAVTQKDHHVGLPPFQASNHGFSLGLKMTRHPYLTRDPGGGNQGYLVVRHRRRKGGGKPRLV